MSDDTDKIPSITQSSKGRTALNIKGGGTTKKVIATFFFTLITILLITGAAIMAISALDDATKSVSVNDKANPTVSNPPAYEAGGTTSRLDATADFFNKLPFNPNKKTVDKPTPIPPTPGPKYAQPKPKTPTTQRVVVINKSDNAKSPAQLAREKAQRIMARKFDVEMMVETSTSDAIRPPTIGNIDDSLTTADFTNGVAIRRKTGSLDFLLIHGTSIPCALVPQIISDYNGIVNCRVTQDVYSANGSALLVERGSKISGTQNVALEQGKTRVFTNWSTIETPNGVSIRIDSLGTGALGAAGSEAWVDDHFAERFGGAIMLSFIEDALSALTENATDSNVQFDNSTDNASDMAAKALDASINIAPTGYTFIGQRINILVARDIDMSNIYQF